MEGSETANQKRRCHCESSSLCWSLHLLNNKAFWYLFHHGKDDNYYHYHHDKDDDYHHYHHDDDGDDDGNDCTEFRHPASYNVDKTIHLSFRSLLYRLF